MSMYGDYQKIHKKEYQSLFKKFMSMKF